MSGNRGNRLRFSKEEDEKLISAVASSPALYDLKHKFYHHHSVRDDTWEEIARNIGKSVVDCKIRWKSLKDVYRKRKKEIADSSTKRHCKWEHMEALQFLEGVVFSRSNNQTKKPADQADLVTVATEDETKDDYPDVKIEVDEEDLESEAACETTMSSEADNCAHQDVVPATSYQSKLRHPIEIFFDSMARTVMDFPPPLAIKTKMEVLQVISKAELELYKAV